jgi:hypothetical protein
MTQRLPPSPTLLPPTPLMDLLLTLLLHHLRPLLVALATMVARTTTIRATPSIVVAPRRQPSLSGPYFRVHYASRISPWIRADTHRSNKINIKNHTFINSGENTLHSLYLHGLGHWPYKKHQSCDTAVLCGRGSIPIGNLEGGHKPYP